MFNFKKCQATDSSNSLRVDKVLIKDIHELNNLRVASKLERSL